MAVRLDPVDWRILKELQANGRMTNVALAASVGISPPPCLRRVRALEQAGMIAGYFRPARREGARLRADRLRHGRPAQPSGGRPARLREPGLGWPLVREAYMLSGESDFMLKCVAQDLTAFQDFMLEELTAAPNVASVKTTLIIRRAKCEPGVPISVPEK